MNHDVMRRRINLNKYMKRAKELKSSVMGNFEHSTEIQDEELVDWLIEQAEKVQKIEFEIDNSDISTGVENIIRIIKG